MSRAGRTGVELAEVQAAVAELAAEERRPTLRAVRERLGRGSLGTIQRHLASLQDHAESALPAEAVPDAVTKAILGFVQERIAAAGVAAAERRADAEEAVKSLAEANEAAEHALEAERDNFARLRQECDVRAGRIAELEESVRVAREEARREASARESAEIRVARLEVQLERLPQTELALSDLQSRMATHDAAIGEARTAHAAATAELAASRENSQHYRERMDVLQADLSRTLAAMDHATRQLKSAEAENARLTAVLERRLGDGGQHVPPAATPKKSRRLAGHGA